VKPRSTLLTSPLSMADFILRLAFFAVAPFAIVLAAELFPVRGALVDVGLALSVFALGEAPRKFASRFRPLGFLLKEASPSRATTASSGPAPLPTTMVYPLLFPYWLVNREARQEFLMFAATRWQAFLILLAA